MIDRSILVQHLDYTAWATRKLLDGCSAIGDEELARDVKSSHGGILDTLRHIYYGDRVWFARLCGEAQPFRDPAPEPSLDDLRQTWPAMLGRFREFIAEVPEADLASDLHYTNLKGEPYSVPRWQVLLHVVNHATLHRGQVMGMLRQIGTQPPVTDLIYFYLQQK